MTSVSVVIPTYNRASTLSRAIESVLSQSRPANEIIVVDDGSTDNTHELLSGYKNVTLLKQNNCGVSAARNLGIMAANGDWIALLDSDDAWLPGKLAAQLNRLMKEPQYRLCHTEEIWIRNGIRVNQMYKHAKSGGWIFDNCLPMCVISPSSSLLHKSVFEEVGLFDESLPACEDYDLWLRICAHQPVLYIDEPQMIKYGGHRDQLSRQHWGMDRFRIQALMKLLESESLNALQYQKTVDMIKTKAGILIKGGIKRGNHALVEEYQLMIEHIQATTEAATT